MLCRLRIHSSRTLLKTGLLLLLQLLTLLLAGQIIYTSTVDVGAAPGFNSETDPERPADVKWLHLCRQVRCRRMMPKQRISTTMPLQLRSETLCHKSLSVDTRFYGQDQYHKLLNHLQQDLENAIAAGEVNAVVNLVNQRQHRLDLDSKWSSSDTAKDVYNFKRPFCTDRNGGLDIIQHILIR